MALFDEEFELSRTFDEVAQAGPPQPSVDGPFPVNIQWAHPSPHLSPIAGLLDAPHEHEAVAFLHRRDDPTQAYVKSRRFPELTLRDGRGFVWFCLVCPRHPNGGPGFVASRKPPQIVAVKQLFKGVEPRNVVLKEISLLQELGDDQHVIRPIEVLEDEKSWYIVTPRARCTLFDVIFRDRHPLHPRWVRSIFRQLLRILVHLARHRVCHRDLTPDNLVFLEGTHRLVAIDFGMALRVPVHPQTGHRALMVPEGSFGTPAYLPPEIAFNDYYDSLFSDLWPVSLTLFNLLTRTFLFRIPHFSDMNFRFFVMANGLINHRNDLAVEVFNAIFPPGGGGGDAEVQQIFRNVALAVQTLDEPTLQLLGGMVQLNASHRLTVAHIRLAVADDGNINDNNNDEIFV